MQPLSYAGSGLITMKGMRGDINIQYANIFVAN